METRTAVWDPTDLASHTRWAKQLALRLVRDASLADDLVQEALLSALGRHGDRALPSRPWFARVLRNLAAFQRRGEGRRRARELDRSTPTEPPSTDELLECAEIDAELVGALTRLRDPYRAVLLLRYYEELEPKEIARRLERPAATVRSQIKRGLDLLRDELDARFGGDRRAWCLPLISFAAPGSGGPHILQSIRETVRAMNIQVKLVATLSLLAFGSFVLTRRAAETAPEAVEIVSEVSSSIIPSLPTEPDRTSRTPLQVSPGVDDEAVLAGVLRDVTSGAPIPHFAFEIGSAPNSERIWTDEEGAFESEETYAAGTHTLRLVDHPQLESRMEMSGRVMSVAQGVAVSIDWSPEGDPIELKAAVGPTFALAIDVPEALELTASLRAFESNSGSPVRSLHAPVRREGDGSPWIRFQPPATFLGSVETWVVELASADGLLGGRAEVAAGAETDSLAIALEPRARLDVRLVSAAELLNPIVLLQSGDDARGMLAVESTLFVAGALPAGEYGVTVRCDGIDSVQSTVVVTAGQVTVHEVNLSSGPSVGHVRGELRSASGSYSEPITLFFTEPTTGHQALIGARWEQQDDGTLVAPFELENVPAGQYELEIQSMRSAHRWLPAPIVVSPPVDDLVLTCRDQDPTRKLAIGVEAADTGGKLMLFDAQVDLEGCARPMMEMRTAGQKWIFDVPADVSLTWFVRADGYVPQWGDTNDFDDDGETLSTQISLEPGWGARCRAVLAGTNPVQPLAGVAFFLDGESAGSTNANGYVDLVSDATPGQVTFAIDGWHFDGGDHDPEAGRLTGTGPVNVLRFAQ